MAKKPRPFNEAFAKLREHAAAPERPPPAREEPPPPPPPAAPPPPREQSEDELWTGATLGVERIEPGPGKVGPAPPPGPPERFWHPDLDAIDELRALVRGDAPFDLSDGDEFIEGKVAGLDHHVVRKLRRGEFAVQGHVDLHGLTRDEAKREVDAFLRASRSSGKRCVLLVHGRGIHSKDHLPVLKDALRTWLSTARFARHVLAFATARPVDGGAGAIYVLLRRAGR
ncbi:MAG TPA: Smr/MutS family protein [Anaeromyxobacter sp.]